MKIRVEVSVKLVNIHVQVENKVKTLKVNKWKLYYSIVVTNLEDQTHVGVVFKKLECRLLFSYWKLLVKTHVLNDIKESSGTIIL